MGSKRGNLGYDSSRVTEIIQEKLQASGQTCPDSKMTTAALEQAKKEYAQRGKNDTGLSSDLQSLINSVQSPDYGVQSGTFQIDGTQYDAWDAAMGKASSNNADVRNQLQNAISSGSYSGNDLASLQGALNTVDGVGSQIEQMRNAMRNVFSAVDNADRAAMGVILTTDIQGFSVTQYNYTGGLNSSQMGSGSSSVTWGNTSSHTWGNNSSSVSSGDVNDSTVKPGTGASDLNMVGDSNMVINFFKDTDALGLMRNMNETWLSAKGNCYDDAKYLGFKLKAYESWCKSGKVGAFNDYYNSFSSTFTSGVHNGTESDACDKFKAAIDSGHYVMIHMKYGSIDHWVLATGYRGDGSKLSDYMVIDNQYVSGNGGGSSYIGVSQVNMNYETSSVSRDNNGGQGWDLSSDNDYRVI